MRAGEQDPLRWRQSTRDPSALPARAADLVDAVREEPPLPAEALARIKVAVVTRRPVSRRALPVGLRFALLAAVFLASVATAKGTMLLWRYVVAPPPPAAPAQPRMGHARPATLAVTPAPVVIPLEPPAPVSAEVAVPPAAAPAHTRHAPPAERRVAYDTTTEAQLLGRALSRLRQDHDARGALKLLDQYASTFPGGVLVSEALSARLEAVLQLDDRAAALRLLDDRSAFAGRLGAEQLLTRAELRASAGRYADALVDFDRLLGPLQNAAAPGTLDRALYGRAVCLGHLGRDDRARADLEAYRNRYPSGRYAAEVSRLLAGAARRAR
jgi:Tetratricopeptide repeat